MISYGAPQWLDAWRRTPAPTVLDKGQHDILVVAYGLVRSIPTLVRTMASLTRYGLHGARVFVVAQCAPSDYIAAHAVLNGTDRLQGLVLTQNIQKLKPRRVCTNMSQTRGINHARYYSAHRALIASIDWVADAVVLWRIDTELCAPIDLQAFRPWEHAHRVHVPCQQNGNFINDRFAYGSASAMFAYQRARLLQLRKNCIYGEKATLAAMHAARIELAFSRVCVVRVRADGYVPDVDQAVMLGTIRARSWMHTINRLSPLLQCNITASPSPLCTVNYHKEIRTRLA